MATSAKGGSWPKKQLNILGVKLRREPNISERRTSASQWTFRVDMGIILKNPVKTIFEFDQFQSRVTIDNVPKFSLQVKM